MQALHLQLKTAAIPETVQQKGFMYEMP